MKKLFTVYLLLLAGMVQGQDLFQGTLFPADLVMKNRETISLTDQQAEKIKTIHGKNAGEFSTLRWDLDAENEKLKKMLQEPKINSEAAQKQMDKILNLENQLKKKQFGNLLAIRGELSEDQAKTLANYSKTISSYVVSSRFDGNDSKLVAGSNDSKGPSIRLTGKSTFLGDKQPLYILKQDGKDIILKGFEDIKPDDIDSITVLKDAAAVNSYGIKAENGVIIITLKKNNNYYFEK